MALIVMTIQDTEEGTSISMVIEPAFDLNGSEHSTPAQNMVVEMLQVVSKEQSIAMPS